MSNNIKMNIITKISVTILLIYSFFVLKVLKYNIQKIHKLFTMIIRIISKIGLVYKITKKDANTACFIIRRTG